MRPGAQFSTNAPRPGNPLRLPPTRRPADRFEAVHDDAASGDQRPGAVDFDDHATQADVDAHRAMQPVRQDSRRVGDVPTVGPDRASGLPPQRGERPGAVGTRFEQSLREVPVQAYRDVWQIRLL